MKHKAKKAVHFCLTAAVLATTIFLINYAVKKGFTLSSYLSNTQQWQPPAPVAPSARDAFIPPDHIPFDITRGTIRTIAGTGYPGFTGNGILIATQSLLNRPCGVRVDDYSNVYILDCGNRRLRQIFPNGNITTLAGNLKDDFPRNNFSAERFSLQNPTDFVWDSDGNFYISDADLNRIIKFDENRLLTFFAGDGEDKNDGDGGLAFNAGIAHPSALAIDEDDNIFVYTENIVRKIDARGIITTVQDAPPNMHCRAVDRDGNLYEAEGNQIIKISDGKKTVIAGTGDAGYFGDGLPADLAELNAPDCVAVDRVGSVYIADTGNNAIRKIIYNR
ncbi:MAG: hypothetical protein FWF35_01725 [Elusimicrobia bacterium]|nr:hypothetical protein [Elusimicrobiota bacterium]